MDADRVYAKPKIANTLIKVLAITISTFNYSYLYLLLFAIQDNKGIKETQNSVPTFQEGKPTPVSKSLVTASTTTHVCVYMYTCTHTYTYPHTHKFV